MIFSAQAHTVTSVEIKGIEALGFVFSGSSMPVDDFLNTHFPNLDLFAAVKSIDTILSPATSATKYKRIILEDNPLKVEIQFFSEDYGNEDTGLVLVRTFTLDSAGPVVSHEFFRLPRMARRKGISKKILTALFQQYVNMGVKKILVFAALEDGGYVWATQYFMAVDPMEVEKILARAQVELPQAQYILAKRVFDNYYAKNIGGQAFPMYKWAELSFMEPILRKSAWHGAVDLTNPVEFSNFVSNAIG
ncbi:hypothetical protein [Puia dinghuensis]|uniref:Uncharacterized protein n=1 Tax=Puia dinghuensis TaxID=1792502 RepID=A0A8J2UHY1_9BACT|nr:hypothetical protein [Puia dinghuensis]GGB19958.1 hypothetical protein GCM10011511_49670 [Puia dinghuensis]